MAFTSPGTPGARVQSQPVHSVFVHLCSGEIKVLTPATSVSVEPRFVIVFNEDEPIATFERRDVYFCSKKPISPALT